ncbi:DUF1097 domain-containing protein [Psychromonas sp. Urea-02u-13]|uniref:DUF1097 domain-containing protein n=1 Tax=Psychromonas sp. Urea-02u-13 TaxID=2058326 RepID=UPI000C338EBE|nr:DUF1097 domain-containing protein [Psychromonas sp. Urea-02u-13]PKG38055.1 DUF1097 domain-containing protein [Psychromonas sp. Urea-02u-13]
MSLLFALSVSTGILSAVLVWFTGLFDIASWLAFLGATSYFACTDKGFKGLTQVWLTNFSGAGWAILIILASSYMQGDLATYAATAVFAFCMCIQAKFNLLKFIPGTFMGAAAIFSVNGLWTSAFIGLFIGAIFGFLMNYCGELLYKYSGRLFSNEKNNSNKHLDNK